MSKKLEPGTFLVPMEVMGVETRGPGRGGGTAVTLEGYVGDYGVRLHTTDREVLPIFDYGRMIGESAAALDALRKVWADPGLLRLDPDTTDAVKRVLERRA